MQISKINKTIPAINPKNRLVIDTKSKNSLVLDTKSKNTLVFNPTQVYQDTYFLNGMSMGPAWYMYVTFNGNRF